MRNLSTIAHEIAQSWGEKVNFAALPYLKAMGRMRSINDNYGMDSGEEIVLRFLCNATTWRGADARRVKAELKEMING